MGNERSINHDKNDTLSTKSPTENVPNMISINPSLQPPQHSTVRSTNLSFEFSNQGGSSEGSSTPHSHLKLTDVPSLTPLPSVSLKRTKSMEQKRKSSLLIAQNGITHKYISSRIIKIAALFWQQNIETLSLSDQLEIGCSIFFGMLSANDEMKKIMQSNFTDNQKIENASLRYLDMMGWLIRYLATDNVDLHVLLRNLGTLHQKMGININHFDPMLQAMHETLSYYFESKYSIEVKYSMDEIFSMAAQIMTGTELKFSTHLMDITKQFQGDDIPFLASLRVCLTSNIGKEYLYRYLSQTWCDEMTIFLQSLSRFKSRMTDKERYMVAKDIVRTSIQQEAVFALNVSYEARTDTIKRMDELKEKFRSKKPFEISNEFFSEVEREVYRLIGQNHWRKFVWEIQDLQSKSFDINISLYK